MNNLKLITFLILIGFTSCGPQVTFDKPQPDGVKNLSKFPKRIQGKFIRLSDNKQLEITNNTIIETSDFELKENINQLDSNLKIIGDSVLDLNTNHKEKINLIGDSILIRFHYTDTIFTIDSNNIVRKFKGYYFLNRIDEFGWDVEKMDFKNGQLRISRIDSKEDIENLVALSDSKQDTVTNFHIKITKKQFKKYIRNDGFNDTETYLKIKNRVGKGESHP